mgnify:CR=1 FL=1
MKAQVDDGRVDAVEGEEGQDVALLPAEVVDQALAELGAQVADVIVGIRTARLAIDEKSWKLGKKKKEEMLAGVCDSKIRQEQVVFFFFFSGAMVVQWEILNYCGCLGTLAWGCRVGESRGPCSEPRRRRRGSG